MQAYEPRSAIGGFDQGRIETEYEIETSGYVPENPCPYRISAPRRRSQPIRIHRSSSSRSTGPASISSPAAMRPSPRRAVLENQEPAIVPAHSTRMSVAGLRHLAEMINQRLQFGPFRSQQGLAVQG
jgi:hypothetical protein